MIRERLAKICKLFRRSSAYRRDVEAQLNAAGPPWAGSVCGACERPECFGSCPGYAEYEQKMLDESNILPLEEGKVRKGGQNPPNTSTKRPPPPKGSGDAAYHKYREDEKRRELNLPRGGCSDFPQPAPRCPNKNCAKCELEASRKKHDAYEKAYIKEARWESPFWAVQQLEEFPGEDREADCLALITTMCEQEGFICGRIINPAGRGWWDIGPYNPVWKVQCFFEDCGEENAAHLPEGMRRVLLLPCMKKWAWYRRKV